MNPQAESVLNLFGQHIAQLVAWTVGLTIVVCALRQGTQFYGAVLYCIWNLCIIAGIWRFDAYVAALYILYSLLAVILLVVSGLGAHSGEDEANQ